MHPALKYSFDDLIAGLEERVQQNYISKKTNGDLTLYNYTNSCTFDKVWDDFTISARGLILHIPTKKIVALPFPKFFNYGENGYDLPDEPFEIFEKVDGSLGIIYHCNDQWNVATRGSFDSEQSKWAKKWLDENVNTNCMFKTDTYLAEIVYPENRIVVKYGYSGLVLLGAYYTGIGQEYYQRNLDAFTWIGFLRPKTFKYESVEDLVNVAKSLSVDAEGFVVRFQSGFRIKIKGDEYCRVHRIISNLTPLGIWESMMNCDNLEEIKKQLPEEFFKDFDGLIEIFQNRFENLLKAVVFCCNSVKDVDNKTLGLLLQGKNDFPEPARNFIFAARKKENFLDLVNSKSSERERIFKSFRPTGNVLEGYSPTNAINRFANENL
jgi:RNA ligase